MPSAKSLTRWQKATALVPLALISAAWTTSLTVTSTASAESSEAGKLPDGTSVPEQAIKAPASISNPGQIAPGVPKGAADDVIAGASTNGIPAAALSAYQRAAQVIGAADKSCNVDWTLVAAIGRVESNHGRYGGNTLSGNGISTPGIYGIPLDGSNNTAKITDTDAGQYDDDTQYDRAVGPMQFIPSTWRVVGVDGDGDGKRNPQDIDDAALATAVYLCSGKEDLSTAAGQRSAVFRYNHSTSYVNLVLSIMRAYAKGDFASVPTSSAGTTTFTPEGDSVFASGTSGFKYPKGGGYSSPRSGFNGPRPSAGGATGGTGGTGSTGGGAVSNPGSGGSTPLPTTGGDTGGDSGGGGANLVDDVKSEVDNLTGGGGNGGNGGGGGGGGNGDGGGGGDNPIRDVMTQAQARIKCLAENPLLSGGALDSCIAEKQRGG